MKIVEDAQFRAELINKIRVREFSERTGIHMSDLNYCLNKQALRKFKPKEDTEQETLLFSNGWALQRWLTGKDEDEPEKEVDGIKVTCDALRSVIQPVDYKGKVIAWGAGGFPKFIQAPWELKATYQSSNKSILDNPSWIRQIMAQCYTQGVTQAYLSRFALMGNWKMRPLKGATEEEKKNFKWEHPTLQAYKLTFTQAELAKNWEWFKGRREMFAKMLETKELLPKVVALPPSASWECDYCSYKEECNDSCSKSDS